MSGRGISDLGLPPMAFRVDRRSPRFETIEASTTEDRYRAKGLVLTAPKLPSKIDRLEAIHLANLLTRNASTGSLASSIDMREHRMKVCGHLWHLVTVVRTKKVRAFTVIPATWEIPADHLQDVDPVAMINGLRVALYGRGAGQANGWLIAFIHSEHDPVRDIYRFHMHGIAYGEMIDVIDRLRTLPNYRSKLHRPDGSRSPVYRRVRRTRKPLENLPAPITYLLQSFWPSRALVISEDGKRYRARRKSRIKQPRHSQVLLSLHRHRLEDLTLMVGLRVTNHGLKQTKPVS